MVTDIEKTSKLLLVSQISGWASSTRLYLSMGVSGWESKFQRNTERDRYVISKLTREGIRVLIVWECTINSMKKKAHDRLKVVSLINEFLQSEQVFLEI